MATCLHGNSAPEEKLRGLPASQSGLERHKCTICAYEIGFEIGIQRRLTGSIPVFQSSCKHGSSAPEYILRELPESQAGSGRHKCAICAFHEGLVAGIGQKQFVPKGFSPKKVPVGKGSIEKVDLPKKTGKLINAESKTVSTKKLSVGKKVDYPQINAERMMVGYLGELLVLQYEKELLLNSHLENLAVRVQHSSMVEGDGLGYDILSFMPNGEPKYIEVKTTTGASDVPFYMSANEVEFASLNGKYYYLYRVFEFNEKENYGKFYLFHGNLSGEFDFTPITYQVTR